METTREKPRAVAQAEVALWVWTAWACIFGVCQSWINIPDIESMIAENFQGMIVLDTRQLLQLVFVGYGALAVISGWIVWEIGKGKSWARSSLLWGLVFEFGQAVFTPHHGVMDFLADVPDFGFQGYAAYLLYTSPGQEWFARGKKAIRQRAV